MTNDPIRKHHYFISDLHLDASQPQIRDAFVNFLQNQLVDAASLYILGDFFEVWLGDDDDESFNLEVIESLRTLTIPVYIMHGNRDFLIGEKFCQQTNSADKSAEKLSLTHLECQKLPAWHQPRLVALATPHPITLPNGLNIF